MTQAAHNQAPRKTIQVTPECHKLLTMLAEREIPPAWIGTLVHRLAITEVKRRARKRVARNRAARLRKALARDAAQPVEPQRLQDEQHEPPVAITEQET